MSSTKTGCIRAPSVSETSAVVGSEVRTLFFAIEEVGNHFLLPPISNFAYY